MTDHQRTTYQAMRASLLARLAEQHPALRSRTTDDFTVAALDGWATLSEILGFHSARIHEESSLDLATELRSLIELARLLGYQPDPGVAATASLVFTVDDATGGLPVVTIPAGTPITRTPPPGEPSFTFETVEAIEARAAWNRIRPQLASRQDLSAQSVTVLLAGTSTNVLPGDGMLIPLGITNKLPANAAFGVVTSVTVRPDDLPIAGQPQRSGWTKVTLTLQTSTRTWAGAFDGDAWFAEPALGPPLAKLVADSTKELDDKELLAHASAGQYPPAALVKALRDSRGAPGAVMVFRTQTGILGSGAPEWLSLPQSLRDDLTNASWTPMIGLQKIAQMQPAGETQVMQYKAYLTQYGGFEYENWADANLDKYPGVGSGSVENVFTDAVVRGLGPGICVLRDGDTWSIRTSTSIRMASKAVFTVSGRSSVLGLSKPTGDNPGLSSFSIRQTTVHVAGEWLALAPKPLGDVLPGGPANSVIMLDDWYDGLTAGQRVHVSGRSHPVPGVVVDHVSKIRSVSHVLDRGGGTEIDLVDPLPDDLIRDTVVFNANVAPATHGETRSEILANADIRTPMPRFGLSAAPLTYVTAPGGSESTLTVYVNGVRRDEVPALLDPVEQGYVLRHGEDGSSSVQFGSPLPTGVLNVRASYRVGLGTSAAIGADQLTMLTRRPAGVRSVTNPLPAKGGADPETVEAARVNAPISVRTLGRIVSLADYEDYARAFPGVAKAVAVRANLGGLPGVLLTVAGDSGGVISAGDEIHDTLARDLRDRGDPLIPISVIPHVLRPFRVVAGLRVDPRRVAESVATKARAALVDAFGFQARGLGQPVTASEVIGILQGVEGVLAASVSTLCRLDKGQPEGGQTYLPFLAAHAATTAGSGAPVGTELLLLDAQPPVVEVLS